MPQPNSESLIARRRAVVPNGIGHFHPTATAAKAAGALITDADGKELIDFAGGIGVMNVGHGDPDVVKAIQKQAESLLHTCIHVAVYEPYVALCEKLAELFPHGDRTKVQLINTGAEAVENAVKIARQATGRPAVICFNEAFHGRTLMAMTLTSKAGYKLNCGPFAPEVYRLPFPNRFLHADGLSESEFVQRELRRLKDAFTAVVPAQHVAAVIIEPVQGEGGFVHAPFEYLRGLRNLCDQHGILLILDEVQSGFCRTGKWAAYQHAAITPDLSTWAKSMGGGLPISCVIGRADIMDAARPGTLGGTYGGNPVACAAALAAIASMEKKNLNKRADDIGKLIRARFENLRERLPSLVADVRGLGAMIALALYHDNDPTRPATETAAKLLKACLDRGLLLITSGAGANIIRVLCPLVITDAQLHRGLDILDEELTRLARSAHPAPAPAPAAHHSAAR